PAGDDWKIIFMKKNSNLAEDLLEMTKFSTSIFYKLEDIVKGVFEDSSVHISVFALSKYEVYINENQEAEYGYKSMIDFSSSEVDLMLKYIEKSKISNTIMVGGVDYFFGDKLKLLLLDRKTNPLKDIVADKNKAVAEKLNVVFGLAMLK
ncbi:MAG TPA: hypothetical protein PK443_01930, partial [bacterium]|nr:hypothetical protein [bacterium]